MIKTHKELAALIAGKRVLHLNSLGKDGVVCLEWLTSFAAPSHVVSVFYKFISPHPDDERYLNYLRRRYPTVEFITRDNAQELSYVYSGIYQNPIEVLFHLNRAEYNTFDRWLHTEDIRQEFNCEYVCSGYSKYESFDRATFFHKKGLVDKTMIYPLGMMSKAQVLSILEKTNLKIHPSYKLSKSTHDHPTYYKMRAAFLASPEFKKSKYALFPLLALDEYRFEELMNG